MAEQLCRNGGCAMAAEPAQAVPCLTELESFFGCFASIPNICTPTEEELEDCLEDADEFAECSAGAGPVVDDPPDPPDPQTCMPPSCNCNDEPCAECYCENSELGAEVLEFCADVCAT
jgi:hypothetical protein